MKHKYIILLFLFTIVSCSNESIRIEYYESGQIRSEVTIKNGKKNGKAVYYYENGDKKQEGFFVNDKLSGVLISYYENGNVNIKLNFIDSLRIGWAKKYLPTGELLHLSENLIIDPNQCMNEPIDNKVTSNSINYVNQQIHYHKNKIKKSESYFFTINGILGNTDHPLYNKGETLDCSIKLETPRYKNGSIRVFFFDNESNLNEYAAEDYICNIKVYLFDSLLLQGYIEEKDSNSNECNYYFINQWLNTK